MNVWQAAAELVRQTRAGALATIARARGSTPVPAGTKMLVGPEGRLLGSVGGGCVEADVIGAALDAQAHRRPALVTHHLNADLAGDLGLSCGGTVDIFVEPLLAADVATALVRYPLTEADAVVIATRGHRNDAEILERVATSAAGYVGLLGSRRKKIVVTRGLKAAGVPAKSLQRVRVPVGLPIGAVTPEEIAVSVVAELIGWRRGHASGRGRTTA